MTLIREFLSGFTRIRRTPVIFLHVILPVVIAVLFLVYYAFAGWRIIPDVRSFFILLQMGYPLLISIVVPIFLHPDRNIHGLQNALGIVPSRGCVYGGKLIFMLFFSALSVILYEVCFFVGTEVLMGMSTAGSPLMIFCIFMMNNLLIYVLNVPIAFRFGPSVSVLLGISGTILAGLFENPIGDRIWMLIPWEWGVRLFKYYFGISSEPVVSGIISMVIIIPTILVLSILWYNRWEGKATQE